MVHDPHETNSNIAAIYYNKGKRNPIRINVDFTLSDSNDQFDLINCRLHNNGTRMMVSVEYWHSSIDSDERIQFTCMKLKSNDNVRTTLYI